MTPDEALLISQTRALLAVGAGTRFSMLFRVGDWARFEVSSPTGTILSNWPSVPFWALGPSFRLIVPVKKGYKVRLVITRYYGKHLSPVDSKQRYPFEFRNFKRRRRNGNFGLILIKGYGSDDLQTPLLKARSRLNASNSHQGKKRLFSKSLSMRPNPTLWYDTIPRYRFSNGTSVPTPSFTFVKKRRGWSSVTTPGFGTYRKKRIRLPINPYSVYIEDMADGRAMVETWTSNGSGSTGVAISPYQDYFGTRDFGGGPIQPSLDTSVDFRAIRKLIERVGPSNNIAQDLAQMSQTTKLIADSAKRIASAINDTRRGNFAGAANSLWQSNASKFGRGGPPSHSKNLADNWLAFQYGWKPLLQDIQGSMESLAQLNLAQTQTWSVKSSASSELNGEVPLYQNVASGNRTGSQSYTSRSTVRYGIRYRYDNHLTTFLAQTGFTNPINLAWEVLPYSFVVDWFLPIGPYLESFSAWDGLEFVDGWKSVMHEVINIWDVSYSGQAYPSDPHDVQMTALNGACRHTAFSYERTKLSSFPSPKFPSFKNPVSVTHALNAMALMVTAFHR